LSSSPSFMVWLFSFCQFIFVSVSVSLTIFLILSLSLSLFPPLYLSLCLALSLSLLISFSFISTDMSDLFFQDLQQLWATGKNLQIDQH
jgi:hypothetical protein